MIYYTYTGGGSDFSSHVTDGSHSSTGDGVDTRAVVLHNGAGTTLDGQDAGYLQDDVLGTGPALQFTWWGILIRFGFFVKDRLRGRSSIVEYYTQL